MADSPLSEPPSGAGDGGLPPLNSLDPIPFRPSAVQPSAILEVLREEIACGTRDLSAISAAIAKAAQALTSATATALAIRHDGVVLCVGRSGGMAPELGSRLSVDSGISGECLRTGKILRCDDTEKDFRADPEVCQRLGLRSIAAVPLRGRYGTMGVLEAFSTRSYAFAEEDMNALRELAELAETARARTYSTPAAKVEVAVAASSPAPAKLPAVAEVVKETAHHVITNLSQRLPSYSKSTWILSLSAVILLVVSVVSWRAWRASASEPTSNVRAAIRPMNGEVPRPAQAVIEWTPAPARKLAGFNAAGSKSAVQSAASREPEVVITQPVASPAGSSSDVTANGAPGKTGAETAPPASLEPPQIAANMPERSALNGVLSGPTAIPAFGTPVSQGVKEGVLIRKIQPVYPPQAVPMRVEGTVVLQATIAENGSLQDLKVVSGHPVLAPAAISAVRQWRYRPYELNGKPVPMQTQITVNFKAP